MSKTFFESIIPFITSMRKGISSEGGSTPKFIKFNNGDKFVDFHFDTTCTPNKDDFNWTEGDGFVSVMTFFGWHQHGEDADIDYNAIAAQYIPVGYAEDIPEEWGDILVIMDFSGNLIYANNEDFAHMAFGESYTAGWQEGIDSFRSYIEKYEIDYDLSSDSYGEMFDEMIGEDDYAPDYTQAANGKVYGFLDGDIKQ